MSATGGFAEAPRRLGANYHKLFTASMCSNLGDGLMSVAVVWLASSLTRDATLIALVALMTRLPWLLFSLPAGVIVDRYDRRRLVASMDVVRFAVLAVFAFVLAGNPGGLPSPEQLASGAESAPENWALLLGLLYLTALMLGSAEVVRDSSAQTLMPSIVHKSQLEKANGRLWGAETVLNNFVGPPLTGLLIATAIALPFFLNAGLLAVAAALVLFAQEVLGLYEGWQYGLVTTGVAIGAVTGSLLAHRVSKRLSAGTALLMAMIGMGVSTGLVGLSSSAPVVWALSILLGATVVLWNVIAVSLRQRLIPDHLLGRVMSVFRFFGRGMSAIATLLTGLVVEIGESLVGREWALRAPFVISGAVILLLLIYALPRINTAQIRAAEGAAEAGQA